MGGPLSPSSALEVLGGGETGGSDAQKAQIEALERESLELQRRLGEALKVREISTTKSHEFLYCGTCYLVVSGGTYSERALSLG